MEMMVNNLKKLTEHELEEMKELCDSYPGPLKKPGLERIGKMFGVNKSTARYHLVPGKKEIQNRATNRWRKNNPEKMRLINKRANKKWRRRNPEKVRAINRRNTIKRYYKKRYGKYWRSKFYANHKKVFEDVYGKTT